MQHPGGRTVSRGHKRTESRASNEGLTDVSWVPLIGALRYEVRNDLTDWVRCAMKEGGAIRSPGLVAPGAFHRVRTCRPPQSAAKCSAAELLLKVRGKPLLAVRVYGAGPSLNKWHPSVWPAA